MGIEFCAIIMLVCAAFFWIGIYHIEDAERFVYFALVISFIVMFIISAKFGSEIAYKKAVFGYNPYRTEILYKQVKDSVFIPVDTILIRK